MNKADKQSIDALRAAVEQWLNACEEVTSRHDHSESPEAIAAFKELVTSRPICAPTPPCMMRVYTLLKTLYFDK